MENDEMDEYRERIERRYGERRLKNERRQLPERPAPRFIEKEIVLDLLFFLVLGVLLYFTH